MKGNYYLFFLIELQVLLLQLWDLSFVDCVIYKFYLFQFEGFLFVLFMVSFVVQNCLSLIRTHLFIFVFIFIILGGGSKKKQTNKQTNKLMSKNVLPMFSSKSFILSGLTFRFLIQFEIFLCVHGGKDYFNFFLWNVAV